MENVPKQSNERLSQLQLLAAALCFLTVLIDGFDAQAAAFAGPLLKREFAIGPEMLGLIFGLGMFPILGGLMLLAGVAILFLGRTRNSRASRAVGQTVPSSS